MQSLSPSYPQHITGSSQFHFCIKKERILWQKSTETRSYITIPPLALPKSGTVEDLSSSQPVTQAPAGSFFSVFQYSTHLSRCQTSLPGRKNPGIYHNKSYFEISSIRRSSSAVNGAQWIAFTLSRICCGLEAPIRTLVTSLC